MPRSARPASYGPEYEEMLLKASSSPDGLTLTFPTPKMAFSLRAKTYAYFHALRNYPEDRPDLIERCESLILTVEGCDLRLLHRDDAWDAVALRTAMGLEKGFAELGGANTAPMQASGQKSMLDSLHELRKRNSSSEK